MSHHKIAEIEKALEEGKQALKEKNGCRRCKLEIYKDFFRKVERILGMDEEDSDVVIKEE